jgi:hypothetical protein
MLGQAKQVHDPRRPVVPWSERDFFVESGIGGARYIGVEQGTCRLTLAWLALAARSRGRSLEEVSIL